MNWHVFRDSAPCDKHILRNTHVQWHTSVNVLIMWWWQRQWNLFQKAGIYEKVKVPSTESQNTAFWSGDRQATPPEKDSRDISSDCRGTPKSQLFSRGATTVSIYSGNEAVTVLSKSAVSNTEHYSDEVVWEPGSPTHQRQHPSCHLHPENDNTYVSGFQLGIQVQSYSWSWLENLKLWVWVPHSDILTMPQRVSDWQSHLLHSSAPLGASVVSVQWGTCTQRKSERQQPLQCHHPAAIW